MSDFSVQVYLPIFRGGILQNVPLRSLSLKGYISDLMQVYMPILREEHFTKCTHRSHFLGDVLGFNKQVY